MANPFMQNLFPNGFMPAVRNNSDMLVRTGIGLATGRNAQEQIALGGQGFLDARQATKDRQKLNQTMQFLYKANPQLAQAVDAGVLSPADAYKEHLRAQRPGSGVSFGKSPIYGTNAAGETVLGTIGDDGSFKQLDTGGFNPSTGFDKIDLGTHWQIRDKRTGQVVGMEPKQNFQESFDKGAGATAGKAQGEAQALYTEMQSRLPGLQQVVSQLETLADKATYTYAGQGVDAVRKQIGMDPGEGALARTEYIAMVDNQVLPLLRQTFGAAFTVKEGESLRATLGDPNKSPEEKKRVLRAFIEQKKRDIEAQAMQAGSGPAIPTTATSPAEDPLGIR